MHAKISIYKSFTRIYFQEMLNKYFNNFLKYVNALVFGIKKFILRRNVMHLQYLFFNYFGKEYEMKLNFYINYYY